MMPAVLKKALITFKHSSVHSSSAYNINSHKFKVPTPCKTLCPSILEFPESFTLYHHVENDISSFSLLSLCTEFDKHKFHPFNVEVNFGCTDLTNFCFLQNEMSDSYAVYFSSEDCPHIAPIKTLTTLLKQQTITSFLFVPCAHNILLDYFASDHTLPKIARGSTDPLTVLKGSHPLKLFQLYHSYDNMKSLVLQSSAKQKLSDLCVKLFHTRPTRVLTFKINTFEVLSQNKIKTIIFSFLKSLPISPDMLTLLQLQTRVIFSGHPKIESIFTNHIAWCKKWMLVPFSCACSQMASILNVSLSISNPHISVLGPMTSSKFDRVLHSNMNNVCIHSRNSFWHLSVPFMTKHTPSHGILWIPYRMQFMRRANTFLRIKPLTVFIPLFQPLIHHLNLFCRLFHNLTNILIPSL